MEQIQTVNLPTVSCRMCGQLTELKADGLCIDCYYALKDEYEQEERESLMEDDRRARAKYYGCEIEEVDDFE